uniref:Uncharacterized protein n=1 Tax=Panagrolaimus sp. ES5 TaxID=591445 RepID=A0AC34G9D9_9BILA
SDTTSPTTLTQHSAEDSVEDSVEEEEESEMQFMQASDPSEFEKNVKFRHSFETVFKGKYEVNGEIDQWLKNMTNERLVKSCLKNLPQHPRNYPHQKRQQHFIPDPIVQQPQHYVSDDETLRENENDDDDDDGTLVEEKSIGISDLT